MNPNLWICVDYNGEKWLRPMNRANCESYTYLAAEVNAEKVKRKAPPHCVFGKVYNIDEIFAVEHYKKIKIEFDNLTEYEQWEWLLNITFKREIRIWLDNDSTYFHFIDPTLDEIGTFHFKNDIGNRSGTKNLLLALGFNVEFV